MGRKKLIYLQLYVKDYTGDERLRWCSPSSWGVYSYLLCLLNTSEVRGSLQMSHLEQRPHLKKSLTQRVLRATSERQRLAPFAELLQKQMPWKRAEILKALIELAQYRVITIQGDMLIQPRMYREGGHHIETKEQGARSEEQEPCGEAEGEEFRQLQGDSIAATKKPKPKKKPSTLNSKPSTLNFKPPTLEEVRAFFQEKGTTIDPEAFFAHYEANGWVQSRGKPIRNWKACLTTWEKREADFTHGKPAKRKNDTVLKKEDIGKEDVETW